MPAERSLTQLEAQQLAAEFRAEFRNTEAFTAAWDALFSLRSAITPTLARRILGEELQKFQVRTAGLVDYDAAQPSHVTRTAVPQEDKNYQCPSCRRTLSVWQRDGHAPDCEHLGCYELEIKLRVAVARREVQRAERKAALLQEDPMLDIERA